MEPKARIILAAGLLGLLVAAIFIASSGHVNEAEVEQTGITYTTTTQTAQHTSSSNSYNGSYSASEEAIYKIIDLMPTLILIFAGVSILGTIASGMSDI